MADRTEKQRVLLDGVRTVLPMLPGVVPFGMTAGIAAVDAGLEPIVGLGMSLIIFAGASQLVVAQLIDEGALPVIIVLTALIINLRMVMYSASLAPHLGHLPMRWKAPLAYLLTDQAYALSVTQFNYGRTHGPKHWFYLGTASPLWVVWLLATAIGVWLGTTIPASWQVGFALPLVFLVLLVPVIRDRPSIIAAVIGGGVAIVAHDAPYHLGLTIGAVSGVFSGIAAELAFADKDETP